MYKVVSSIYVSEFQQDLNSLAKSGYQVIGYSTTTQNNGDVMYSAIMIKYQEL